MSSYFDKSSLISPTIILATLILASAGDVNAQKPVSPDGLLRPEEVYRPPSIRERSARMEEMEREAARPRTPEEETLALAEVAEDFKHIQLVNNKMMAATMSAAAPDFGNIAVKTDEIRKRAIRIRRNLQLPKLDAAEAIKESELKRANDARQLKAALLELDTCIMNFIRNPIFANPDVISAESAAKVKLDLEKIIVRSRLINRDAEQLKKSSEQRR